MSAHLFDVINGVRVFRLDFLYPSGVEVRLLSPALSLIAIKRGSFFVLSRVRLFVIETE